MPSTSAVYGPRFFECAFVGDVMFVDIADVLDIETIIVFRPTIPGTDSSLVSTVVLPKHRNSRNPMLHNILGQRICLTL